jgi:hypothetical protein
VKASTRSRRLRVKTPTLKSGKKRASAGTKVVKECKKPCPVGKQCNPQTGRCKKKL